MKKIRGCKGDKVRRSKKSYNALLDKLGYLE